MALTTSRGFHYPVAADTPDVPRDILALANDINGMWIQSTRALRPAFGVVGREHYSTDTGQVSLDIGTAWVEKRTPTNASVQGRHLALGTVNTTVLENLANPGFEVTLSAGYARLARVVLPAQGGTSGNQRLTVRWRIPYFCNIGTASTDGSASFYLDYGTYGPIRTERIGMQTASGEQAQTYDDVYHGEYTHPPLHDDEFDVTLSIYGKKNNSSPNVAWVIRTNIWFEAQWTGA